MQQCMKKYQNNFSMKFAQLMQKNLVLWKEIQKQEKRSLYGFKAITSYFLFSLLGFIPGKNEHNYHLELHICFAIICFILAVIGNIHETNKRYQKEIKSSLFPELLTIFGENIFYNKPSGIIGNHLVDSLIGRRDILNITKSFNSSSFQEHLLPNSLFENCGLYNREIEQRDDDDAFSGNFNGVKFTMVETDFGWKSRDKYRTYHSMFRGLAMKFSMNKFIANKVFILTKHSFTKIPKNFERVTLESAQFNKKYDIWVEKSTNTISGQIEARYLLNTVFMERLMQIQTSFRINKMCCCVWGDEMLIMLSTNRDLFEMNHLFGQIDDIRQYKHLFEEFASVLSFIEVLKLDSKTKL